MGPNRRLDNRLDERTLLVGRGYRTNAAGVEVLEFDLPHWHGRGEVMHLMSLISLLDDDLALVYEISRKGDGGPTCLTRPLLRA